MVREIHNTYNVSILSLYKHTQILYPMQINVVASADNVAFRSSRNDHIYELRAKTLECQHELVIMSESNGFSSNLTLDHETYLLSIKSFLMLTDNSSCMHFVHC